MLLLGGVSIDTVGICYIKGHKYNVLYNSICVLCGKEFRLMRQPPITGAVLPTRFFDAGDESVCRHFPKVDTGDAEFAHISFWASGEFAAVVQADGTCILGKFLEGYVVSGFF